MLSLFNRVVSLKVRPAISVTNWRAYCHAKKKNLEGTSRDDVNNNKLVNKVDSEKQNEDNEEEKRRKFYEEQEHFRQTQQNLIIRGDFDHVILKNKETFLQMIRMFKERDVHRRNHVEFIYAALKHMREYNVNRDLAVYKELIDVMPKGKFVITNMFQDMFMHYPKQQQCMMDLLDEMSYHGVMPDFDMEDQLVSIFGKRGHPVVKFWRMMYWIPKFKHLNPWLLPNPVPDDALELAKLAVAQMCTIDMQSKVHVFQTNDVDCSIDKTWIVSGQSPEQRKLLKNHPKDSALQIEGPFFIWLRDRTINYFTLVGDAVPDHMFEEDIDTDDVSDIKMPEFLNVFGEEDKSKTRNKLALKRSIHQQDDGTIYAICATGTSTKDSLLSWVRLLEKNGNSILGEIPVLFKFKSDVNDKALVTTQ